MPWPVKFSIYGAGDASSSGDFAALTPFLWKQLRQLQGVVTNEQVAGVAQLDGMSHPTFRWVLDPLSRFRPQQLGETNTGDPQGLVDFCAWANANCPAEVEVLILSGHGLAFQDARTSRYLGRGVSSPPLQIRRTKRIFGNRTELYSRAILMDETDFVSVPELKSALSEIASLALSNSVGVLVFDACLMSNIELLFEIHDSVEYVVGAVDEISGVGLNLAGAASLTTHLSRNGGNVDGSTIARIFSETYEPVHEADSCLAISLEHKKVQRAISSFAELVSSLSRLDYLESSMNLRIRAALSDGSRQLVKYRNKSLADVAAFSKAFTSAEFPPEVRRNAKKFRSSVSALVLEAKLGSSYKDALGITIFSPTDAIQFQQDREDYRNLVFSNQTGWLKFLDGLFSYVPK